MGEQYRDEIAMVCHDMMKSAYAVGAVTNAEMREFEKDCFIKEPEAVCEIEKLPEMALLDMARQIPQSKQQELYDFAHFLVEQYGNTPEKERIAAFESENEMIDFINNVGRQVYAD